MSSLKSPILAAIQAMGEAEMPGQNPQRHLFDLLEHVPSIEIQYVWTSRIRMNKIYK